jgi:hypothetical protein
LANDLLGDQKDFLLRYYLCFRFCFKLPVVTVAVIIIVIVVIVVAAVAAAAAAACFLLDWFHNHFYTPAA